MALDERCLANNCPVVTPGRSIIGRKGAWQGDGLTPKPAESCGFNPPGISGGVSELPDGVGGGCSPASGLSVLCKGGCTIDAYAGCSFTSISLLRDACSPCGLLQSSHRRSRFPTPWRMDDKPPACWHRVVTGLHSAPAPRRAGRRAHQAFRPASSTARDTSPALSSSR